MRLKNASEATPQTDEGLVPTAGVERTPAAAPLRREAAVSSRIEATVAVVWPVGSPSTGVRAMNVARTAAEVLAEHATLELECVDRMYLNAYVPILQTCGGAAWFFRKVRGKPVPSSALMAPMTRDFVAGIERFAEGAGVEVVKFGRRERKEERMREHLRRFPGGEGVLFVGKAQEKTKVVRSERRIHEPSASHYVQLVHATAMVNHYYFYLVDDDFGPMFVKFCSYFPYTARLCVNGHEYVKRQLAKRGVAFEALDNGLLSCADPALAQRLADELSAERIDDLLRKWLKRLPHPFTRDDRAAGIRYEISILQAEFALTQVFDRPVQDRVFFEEVIRENLDLGRPDRAELIFGRRIDRRTRTRNRLRVVTNGVVPSLLVDYKHSHVRSRRAASGAYYQARRKRRVLQGRTRPAHRDGGQRRPVRRTGIDLRGEEDAAQL